MALVLIAAIVIGSLANAGTFKRGNILLHSKNGDYDINQQMATYMVWNALYSSAYTQWQYSEYFGNSIADQYKEEYGQTITAEQYCLMVAASGVQDTLRTSIENETKPRRKTKKN